MGSVKAFVSQVLLLCALGGRPFVVQSLTVGNARTSVLRVYLVLQGKLCVLRGRGVCVCAGSGGSCGTAGAV